MAKLTWDDSGTRLYETGVNKGVLYEPDGAGNFPTGIAWNGLTTVTEAPTGAEATAIYADNIKYLNLISAEDFGATIEAYTFPTEFAKYDGTATATAGVYVGQQSRKAFGLSYQTRVGNDVLGSDFGYKIHLIYNATAAPSEKAFATINDTPEAITFSWELSTTAVTAGGTLKPTAQLTIDSTKCSATKLIELEDMLYGTAGAGARLPLPPEVIALFQAGALTPVDTTQAANQPTYNSGTRVITLPTVTGIQWKINGVNKTNGAQPAMTVGQTSTIVASPIAGYVLTDASDDTWVYSY